MRAVLVVLATSMVALLGSRASLQLEILALCHQLAVLQGGGRRPRLKPADRLLWVWLSRAWSGWQDALVLEAEHGYLLAAQAVSRPLDSAEPTRHTRPAHHRPGDVE